MAHGAENLPALRLHEVGCLLFQRIAESIVGGEEEPGIAALLHQGTAGTDRQRMGVVGPVETIGRAGLTGQVGGRGTGDDVDLLLVGRDALHRQRHGGRGQFHDGIDLLGVVPLARDVGGDVRLVLVIGADHLDRRALHFAAEILDRHLGGLERPFTAEIGIDARLVVENPDLDLAVRDFGGGRRKGRGGQDGRRHQICELHG